MATEAEIKQVVAALKKAVMIAIEWDGYAQDPQIAYDIQERVGELVSFVDVERSVGDALRFGDASADYSTLRDGVARLNILIRHRAIEISARATALSQPVDKIPSSYWGPVARVFVMRNLAACVLVAPDLWRPEVTGTLS
jgi:hypothetical protein